VKNVDDIVARLQAFAPAPKAGEWITAQGWDEGYFGSVGYPDRAKVDAAVIYFAARTVSQQALC